MSHDTHDSLATATPLTYDLEVDSVAGVGLRVHLALVPPGVGHQRVLLIIHLDCRWR